MKKTLMTVLVVASSLLCVNTFAQGKKTEVGIKGGLNVTNLGDNSTKIGFNVGATLDYQFVPNVYLMTGLGFTTKGSKTDDLILVSGNGIAYSDVVTNAMYLELPVHIGYKLSVANNLKLVFRGGAYVAYGVGGKITSEKTLAGEKLEFDTFSDFNLKRFDFGVGVGAGVEYHNCTLGVAYDYGLVNVLDVKGGDWRNKDLSINVGYKF